MYGDCKICGHDYYSHRPDDLKCPRVRPYIAGVVNVGDYESETTYSPVRSRERSEDGFNPSQERVETKALK